jgi:cytochrome P450
MIFGSRLPSGPAVTLTAAPGPAGDAARWILEWNGIEYREVAAPAGDPPGRPRVRTPEITLCGVGSVLRYYDARSPARTRLLPADAAERREVEALVEACLEALDPTAGETTSGAAAALARIGERIADGGAPLVGDRFTAADLLVAAVAASPLLPAPWSEAGARFARRVHGESRVPTLDGKPLRDLARTPERTAGERFRAWAGALVTPGLLRLLFKGLRRFHPVMTVAGNALVTRHADALEVLGRDRDFTIAEINAANMDRINGPFILGMDRSEDYDREAAILRSAVRADDPGAIRKMVASDAAELIEAARPNGRIDVVGMLARVVAVRLLDRYFGVPGPTEALLGRWMRALFWDLFFNTAQDGKVRAAADACAADLRAYLRELIRRRRAEIESGRDAGDDFLARLIRARSGPAAALDDDGVRRNISGVIVGAVDTTVAAVGKAVDQLLRRPDALEFARRAALANDMQALTTCAFEALRFDPQTTAVLRFCARETTVGRLAPRPIPARTRVIVFTLSAMFDPTAYDDPDRFQGDRSPEPALHFGAGMHQCFGRYVNFVQVPELVKAVVGLKGVRRARGSAGRLSYEGPFPDHLVVEFDR